MKVYTLTRICANKDGNVWHNEVEGVYTNIEDARAYVMDVMSRIEALNKGKIQITHRNESKGVESIEARYISLEDLSSELYRIKEFEVK